MNEPPPPAPWLTKRRLQTGKAKVTIVANQKTLKNVKADDYWVGASFDVTVKDEKIEAKQTGVNKITVTGTDLTDKTADYVVKRGTVTLSIKEVALNEAKTEAVLTASSSTMPKGDYTLSFNKGDEVAFTVEEGRVAKITVDPESAILDVADATKAYTFFTIYNQFDEDVTKTERANCTIQGATPDSTDIHKVVFSSGSQPYTLNLSKVTLSIVHNKNGVNFVGTLDVTGSAKLAETEFKGLYKKNASTGKYEVAAMTVNDTPGNFFLVFAVKDQYGRSAANNVTGGALKSLQVNLSSVTGLTAGTGVTWTANEVGDWAEYVAYPLALVAGATLNAGEVNVLTVQLTDGKTVTGKFTVAQKQLVDSLSVVATEIYGGQANTLEFTALDQDGKEIKDYETLSRMNSKLGSGLAFGFNADGSAKLVYTANSNPYSANAVSVPVVLTWLSETNKFGQVNLNVQPDRVPKAIIGLADTLVLAKTAGTTEIKPNQFKYQDQYGNTIADAELGAIVAHAAAANRTITVSLVAKDDAFNASTVTCNAVNATSDAVALSIARNAASAGSITLKVAIDGVDASDYTFKVENVSLAKVSNFEIGDINRVCINGATGSVLASFKVYGTYNGTKVELDPTNYEVYGSSNSVAADAIASTEGYKVKEKELTVVVNNAAGTTLTKKYEYSNAPREAVKIEANAAFSGNIVKGVNTDLTVAEVSKTHAVGAWDTTAVLTVIDQYGAEFATDPRVTFSGYSWDATPADNGKTNASIQWSTTGFKTVNVKYVYDNGVTFETTLVVKVQ